VGQPCIATARALIKRNRIIRTFKIGPCKHWTLIFKTQPYSRGLHSSERLCKSQFLFSHEMQLNQNMFLTTFQTNISVSTCFSNFSKTNSFTFLFLIKTIWSIQNCTFFIKWNQVCNLYDFILPTTSYYPVKKIGINYRHQCLSLPKRIIILVKPVVCPSIPFLSPKH